MLKKLIPNVKIAIVPTIVAVAIMLVTLKLFGLENSMIAPFATLSFLRFLQMKCHYQCMLKHFLIYCVIIAAAFIANLSLPACIIVDAAVLFAIGYFVIDEYDPSNFFPFGMALIMLQSAPPITFDGLPARYGALAVSFGIILVVTLIMSKRIYSKDPIHDYVKEGFEICREQLEYCRNDDENKLEDARFRLREICIKCSDEIYAYNRTTFMKKGKINYYCRFIALFQVINYLTYNRKTEGNVEKASKLIEHFSLMLDKVAPQADYWQFNFRVNSISFKDFRLRFALRQMISVVPCMVFAYVTKLPAAYWIAFTLFFMLVPSTEDSIPLIKDRFLGSLVGIAISLILFLVLPSTEGRIILAAVFSFFIYSANSLIPTVAYITIATLAMMTMGMEPYTAMGYCQIYTIVGAVIALAANLFIFPLHTDVQIRHLVNNLRLIRERLIKLPMPQDIRELFQSDKSLEGISLTEDFSSNETNEHKHEKDMLTIQSYLISKRIQMLDMSRPPEMRKGEYLLETEKKHMRFMAAYLLMYK